MFQQKRVTLTTTPKVYFCNIQTPSLKVTCTARLLFICFSLSFIISQLLLLIFYFIIFYYFFFCLVLFKDCIVIGFSTI